MDQTKPVRPLPALDADNHAFWTSGEQGLLMIHRCTDCCSFVHPPVPFCPTCESRNVGPQPVCGRGRIATFTINHKAWMPGLADPYVLALVELDEDTSIRLPTNIIDIPPEQVTIGMPVTVTFERVEDVFVPLFRPLEG